MIETSCSIMAGGSITFPDIAFDEFRELTHGRSGIIDAACFICAPQRRSALNQRRKVLRLWCDDRRITYHCARCGARGWSMSDRSSGGAITEAPEVKADVAARDAEHELARRLKALGLWRRGKPAVPNTPV